MRHELELIKKKAIFVMDHVTNQEAEDYSLDIFKLAEGCITAIDDIDKNVTNIALDLRRVTTGIK